MEEGTTGISGVMAREKDVFIRSGPLHLTHVDWTNFHHRRSIAASLVQGVRVLEFDRQEHRQGQQALAPPWWEFFHFQLVRALIDDVDNSIFGAIYELKFSGLNYNNSAQIVPRFVIAFRGTLKMAESISRRDLELDYLMIRNKLHESSRFQIAMQAVQNMVASAGASNIWLTGHSLGSAIALLAGKNMVKMHSYIETYLFNPPFLSVREIIPNERLGQGIHLAATVIKMGLAHTKGLHQIQRPKQIDEVTNQVTALLSLWVPYLFVNPGDHICFGYIRYFQQRKSMQERLPEISSESYFSTADSESLHRLPSAYLTINLGYTPDFKRAHGIHQWWDPNFHGHSEHYRGAGSSHGSGLGLRLLIEQSRDIPVE